MQEGTSTVVDQTVFEALGFGDYQLEWTISDDNGVTGIAYRSFVIMDDTTPLQPETDSLQLDTIPSQP